MELAEEADHQEDGRRADVLRALAEAGPLSNNRICETVGGRKADVLEIIGAAEAAGELAKDAQGRLFAVGASGGEA